MDFTIGQSVEVLRNTPGVLRGLLGGVSEAWVRNNYGPDTLSAFDVVGHLIHGERADWIPRAKIILEHGRDQPFEPFDRYAMYEASKGKCIEELLDTFESLRQENIETWRAMNLTREQLDLRGVHPALGEVSLRNLLAMWTAHDLNHIAQICKAMVFQYRDEVGPWLAYCSILRPPNRV